MALLSGSLWRLLSLDACLRIAVLSSTKLQGRTPSISARDGAALHARLISKAEPNCSTVQGLGSRVVTRRLCLGPGQAWVFSRQPPGWRYLAIPHLNLPLLGLGWAASRPVLSSVRQSTLSLSAPPPASPSPSLSPRPTIIDRTAALNRVASVAVRFTAVVPSPPPHASHDTPDGLTLIPRFARITTSL